MAQLACPMLPAGITILIRKKGRASDGARISPLADGTADVVTDHSKDARNETLAQEAGRWRGRGYTVSDVKALIRALNKSWYATHPKGPLSDEELKHTVFVSLETWAQGKGQGSKQEILDSFETAFCPLKDRGFDKVQWDVDGFIISNAINIVFCDPGGGKTMSTLSIANAVSRGESWAGRKTRKRRCLVLDRENGPGYLRTIEEDVMGLRLGPDFGIRCGADKESVADVDSLSVLNWVTRCVEEGEEPLLVFDSLRGFLNGDENDSKVAREFLDACIRLRNLGATIIILHHSRKDGKEYRGSSDIKAGCDAMWEMEKTSDDPGLGSYTLKQIKVRAEAKDFAIRYDQGKKTFVADDHDRMLVHDDELLQILAGAGIEGMSQHDLIDARPNSMTRGAVNQFVDRALKDGRIFETGKGRARRLFAREAPPPPSSEMAPFAPGDPPETESEKHRRWKEKDEAIARRQYEERQAF